MPCFSSCSTHLPHPLAEFIEIIVSPMYDMVGQLVELLLKTAKEHGKEVVSTVCNRVWDLHLVKNKRKWKERSKKGVWRGGGDTWSAEWRRGLRKVCGRGEGGTHLVS